MKKSKISFYYECEEEVNDEEIEMIKKNLNEIDLEQDIKDYLDEYLQGEGTTEEDSRILNYRLEFLDI